MIIKSQALTHLSTEATTCLGANLHSTLVIGCRKGRQRDEKGMADGEDEPGL